MDSVQIKLYDLFRKDLNLSDDKARELVYTIEQAGRESESKLASKEFIKDSSHSLEIKMIKNYLLFSVIQLLVILSGVLAIVKFMIDK